nr:MAG TPA: hypothetical protein [Caudoviricetes sp.]
MLAFYILISLKQVPINKSEQLRFVVFDKQ